MTTSVACCATMPAPTPSPVGGGGPAGVTADLEQALVGLSSALDALSAVLSKLDVGGTPVQPAIDANVGAASTGGGPQTPPATPPETAPAAKAPDEAPPPAPAQAAAGEKALYPVGNERISDEFGATKDRKVAHGGLDFARGTGTPIKVTMSGTVVEAGAKGGWGNQILVDHHNGLFTRYAHLVDGGINVKVGQDIKQGDVIGKVGSTGNSTGAHLHFEVYEGGTALSNRRDPHVWLDTGTLKADPNGAAAH